jgi:hypothetical protein
MGGSMMNVPAVNVSQSADAPYARVLSFAVLVVVALLLLWLPHAWQSPLETIARLSGLGVLILLWAVYGLANGTFDLRELAEGADGRLSTSKFQWLLWTGVVIYGFAVVVVATALQGHLDALPTMPTNLLYAMGISTGTMAVAKGVTTAYAQGLQKRAVATGTPLMWGDLFRDDGGNPDLSKTQMMAWTLIAVTIFIANLASGTLACTGAQCPGLPNIDQSLMTLMGLGQAGYLAKKLVTTS